MLKKLSLCVLLVASFVMPSWARIVEIKNISSIVSEIDQDTLVLFDIDHTTIAPKTALGSSAWWDHFKNKMRSINISKERLLPLVAPCIDYIAKNVPQSTVEPEVASLIHSLQTRGITVWALTARFKVAPWDPKYGISTREQLFEFGIDFARSTLPTGVQFDVETLPVSYAHGILFSDSKPKGPVLKDFLRALNHRPSKVVMADDLYSFLSSVDEAMSQEGIPFIGFHYTHLAHLEEQFDLMLANVQLQHLMQNGVIPSDQEAQHMKAALLSKNPSLSPDFYLDQLVVQWKKDLNSNNIQGGTHATAR